MGFSWGVYGTSIVSGSQAPTFNSISTQPFIYKIDLIYLVPTHPTFSAWVYQDFVMKEQKKVIRCSLFVN